MKLLLMLAFTILDVMEIVLASITLDTFQTKMTLNC